MPLSSHQQLRRKPQESGPSAHREPRGLPAAIRRAPCRSMPLAQTSIQVLQGGGPPLEPSQSTEIPARFPRPVPHARKRADQTMDARGRELLVPRSGGCYVVELYNEARTHLSLHKDPPIPRAVHTVGRTLAVPVLGGLHTNISEREFPTGTGKQTHPSPHNQRAAERLGRSVGKPEMF